MRNLRGCGVFVALLIAISGCRSHENASDPAATSANSAATDAATSALHAAVEAPSHPAFVNGDDEGSHVWQETRRFYKQTGYRLAWSDGTRPNSRMDGLVAVISAADQAGKGRLDDLNADGIVDTRDAKFLDDDIDRMFSMKAFQKFQGGMGFYPATSAHPPFVHVDVRGTQARWKG